HHGIFLLLEDEISSNFFNDLTRLSDELPTTREISILTNTEGNFILATTTNSQSSVLEQDFILQTAPQGSQVFIFADESPQHRWWTAISKQQIGDTEYVLYTTHDYTAIDQLIKDRQGSIYVG